MSIFTRKEAPVEEITATAALRARVKSKLKRGHLSRLAMDHSIALPQLENFANGGNLPESALHALTREFYMNARFDPEQDRFIDTSPEPTTVCKTVPEPYRCPDPNVQAAQDAYYAALRATRPPDLVRPPTPGMETAGRLPKRPGFAN